MVRGAKIKNKNKHKSTENYNIKFPNVFKFHHSVGVSCYFRLAISLLGHFMDIYILGTINLNGPIPLAINIFVFGAEFYQLLIISSLTLNI